MSLPIDTGAHHSAVADGSLTLGTFVAELAGGVVEVVAAPRGLGGLVRTLSIWDANNPDGIEEGAVVLGVGLDAESPGLVALVEAAARAGAAAVVAKSLSSARWVRAVAGRVGLAVLTVPRELGWEQVHAIVRTAIAAASVGELAGPPPGDLFELANAAATALGGPVEIDDPALNLLAFSSLSAEADELRRRSILARVPPPDFLDWLRETGGLQRMRSAWTPILLEPPTYSRRLVVPIRAGVDVLGFIWLAEGAEPFGAEHSATLTEIARVASVQILRRRAVEDIERRLRRESLRAALEGCGDPGVISERLGVLLETQFCLLGFHPRDGWQGDRASELLVESLVALRVDVSTPHAAAVTVAETIYAAVPVSRPAAGEVRGIAQEIIGQARRQLGMDLVAGIGWATSLDALPDARSEVDRVVELIRATPDVCLSGCDELRPQAVLAELRELARERPQLLRGQVEVLRELDRTRNTDYITTLRAFFDAACDLTEASKLLYVHRNTLRYRIRRIGELSGLDLADPVERLIAELQLHLLREPADVSAERRPS